MRQSRRNIFIGLLIFLLAVFAWFVLKPREPSYQGKTLTVWLEEAQANDVINYPEADPAAVNAIHQMGANAIPTLLKLAATKDSRLKGFLLMKWDEKPWHFNLPLHSEKEMHMLAERGFYVLGPDAKSAVPGLTALLKDDDDDVRLTAVYCLGCVGPAAQNAVPDLIKEFEREESGTNGIYAAAYAFGKIGPSSAQAAIPALTAALTNSSARCRICAQAALINLQAASLSPFLEELKNTTDVSNWPVAMTIASLCGTNASPAVPWLVSALNSTNSGIQNRALYALGAIHQQPDLCIPAILPLLQSTNGIFQYNSIDTLRRFGKAATPAVPALIRCLDDSEYLVRVNATNALRDIDPEAANKLGIK